MKNAVLRNLAATAVAILSMSLSGCLSGEITEVDVPPPAAGGNTAPTISGTPQAAVTMGQSYAFTPTASDADGDTLTFSIQNLPNWATFDTTTGQLSGTPSLVDIGVFGSIVISVSDGTDTASIPEYSVTVTQVQLGSMSLSWTAPTVNTDGSTLTNLMGYRIYYGLSEGSYPSRVDIDNPSISTYVIENLVPDTYYVVATSINSGGIESAYSNVAIKTVN